jgi:transposase-like protein
MARKAVVDRNIVLQLLQQGKSSQTIANQFGVSRQAIDLYRKEFTRTGLLPTPSATPLPVSTPADVTPQVAAQTVAPAPIPAAFTPAEVSLDQMIELFIKAFDALKRLPELEAEVQKYKHDYDHLQQQVGQMEEREKKRKEQETRWLHAQNPDILTHR